MNSAIEVQDVRKTYRRYGRHAGFGSLKSALLSGHWFSRAGSATVFEALKGVSFDVTAGKTFGIIGRNGSGKSTMLKMIAGIGRPSSGSVRVNGRVSALIELGAGFHPEISGRENVFINGMMLGLSRREIAGRFDEIVAFAEMEAFIDAPVKTYSSGMYMRLGFAVAINVDPDVLLVDEVLAVGDQTFTHRCLDKFAELRQRGKTVLLVTHSLDLVERFCDEALWLDQGVARAIGDPKRVIDAYLLDVARAEGEALSASDSGRRLSRRDVAGAAAGPVSSGPVSTGAVADARQASEGRWGSGEVEITRVELRGAAGHAGHVFTTGEPVEIHLHVRAAAPVTDFVFGVGIFNAEGVCCYGTNTDIEGGRPERLSGEAEAVFIIDALDLVDGTYTLDVAVHRQSGAPYDYHRRLHTFRVVSRLKEAGIYRPRHRWTFTGDVRIDGL